MAARRQAPCLKIGSQEVITQRVSSAILLAYILN